MYSLTGYDPQAFTFWEGLPAEQAACAGRPAIGYFHTCDESLCPQIANLAPWGRVSSLFPSIARQVRFPEPARDIHSQWRYEPCAARLKTILRDAGILAVWPLFKKSHTGDRSAPTSMPKTSTAARVQLQPQIPDWLCSPWVSCCLQSPMAVQASCYRSASLPAWWAALPPEALHR